MIRTFFRRIYCTFTCHEEDSPVDSPVGDTVDDSVNDPVDWIVEVDDRVEEAEVEMADVDDADVDDVEPVAADESGNTEEEPLTAEEFVTTPQDCQDMKTAAKVINISPPVLTWEPPDHWLPIGPCFQEPQ